MIYAQSLSPEIIKLYSKALELDSNNARAIILKAGYTIGDAKI